MGKKINPKIFRLGTTVQPPSKWFANKKDFAVYLEQDQKIRKYLKTKYLNSGISKVEIKRSAGNIELIIYTSKPGVIIGRGGAGVEEIKKTIKRKFFGNKKINLVITIAEVNKPDLDAELLYQGMAVALTKRIPFRRVLKRAIEQAKRAGAKGIKVSVSGRLNGAEIAREELLAEGKIPAHTLRADIDYARGHVPTIYGLIGVKVWIYKGDVFTTSRNKAYEDKDKKVIAKKTIARVPRKIKKIKNK